MIWDNNGWVLVGLLVLLLCGCRSKREVMHATEEHRVSVVVARDTSFSVLVARDSLLHVWAVRSVTTYRPDGTKEREDVEERHSERRSVVLVDSAFYGGTEVVATHEGSATIDKDSEVDAAPIEKTSRNWKWIVWGVVVLVCVVVLGKRAPLPVGYLRFRGCGGCGVWGIGW